MSAPAAGPVEVEDIPMTHRQRIEALVGLLLGMFVAFLSSTIVSNALPTIITDLHGTQNQYTWVVVATLLASTATTPIWGKFADLVSKKLLVQMSLALFTIGSVLAGTSQSVDMLIGFRVIQGLGLGGLQALVVIVVATMFSPRERGRYQGSMAAVMSVATVAGPLIGGLIVDTSWLGWRWTFYVCVPLAVAALLVIQRTLNLPVIRKKVSIDYGGAVLIAAGVSILLIWVTLAGKSFDWASAASYALVALGLVLLAAAVFVESRVSSPIIPLHLFRDRTTTLATLASVAVGVALFGGAVFLGQYFQVARGYSPTAAGLLTLPMIIGSMVSATISGQMITRFGRWKVYLVAGAALMTVGFGLLATIDAHTDMRILGVYLFVLGIGMGMTMQNLVLAVQNNVSPANLGAATSTVTFFRSLGGASGVSVLGAVLSSHVSDLIAQGLSAVGINAGQTGGSQAGLSNLNELPGPIADIVRGAYGDGTARIFLVAGIMAALSLVAICFIKEVALKTMSSDEERRAEAAAAALTTEDTSPAMKTIAVGLDHSQESEAAARWGAAAAVRRGGRLLLVHGYAPAGAAQGLAEFDIENIRDAALARADAVANSLRADHLQLRVDTLVRPELPVPLLLQVSEHVDLLVLGHHRANWLERLTSGSVSAILTARSKCPVVTVPFGNVCFDGPVVVAVDVDAPSDQAIKTAFERARDIGQRVTIICAIPDDAAPEQISDAYARADTLLDPWRRQYPDCPVNVQLVNGDPHRSLAEAVPQASLLVITRPRAGTAFPVWTTSVTRAAHHAARHPIAVVDHSAS